MIKVIFRNISQFGTLAMVGVHQVLDDERDIDNAIYDADRDGFKTIIFYLRYHDGWMTDHDFWSLVRAARDSVSEVEA